MTHTVPVAARLEVHRRHLDQIRRIYFATCSGADKFSAHAAARLAREAQRELRKINRLIYHELNPTAAERN